VLAETSSDIASPRCTSKRSGICTLTPSDIRRATNACFLGFARSLASVLALAFKASYYWRIQWRKGGAQIRPGSRDINFSRPHAAGANGMERQAIR
jgi:hypothetical protein